MVAVNAAQRAGWAVTERSDAITERNRAVWDLHHVEGVPGRQIPDRFREELVRRELDPGLGIAYATVRKIIEGDRP